MPRRCRWLAVSLLLAAAPAAAAVVRERSVTIEVRADGVVREREAWTVLVQSAADLDRWSPYAIYLDDNRRLVRLEGSARRPDGKVIPVKRKRRDRTGLVGEGVLHASQEAELVDFSPVPDGSVLHLEYEVEERPYFPSGAVWLGGDDAVEQLRVEVRANGLRARLSGAPAGLRLDEGSGTAVVTGSVQRQPDVKLAPEDQEPALRYAWGTAAEWPAVGGWYRDLVGQVPRGSAAARALAESVAAGARGQQAVERLLAYVQREIRYVAVEVGIGGYRPSAPEQVLARRWGDCKDKALLLVELLGAVGVDARLALVHASERGDIDAAFPAPDEFNHVVVALPAGVLAGPTAGAPKTGWVFVDPTQPRGGIAWLHPWLAGHRALVVTPTGGELATVPVDPSSESERLTLDLTVDGQGKATGKLRLELRGAAAASQISRAETERPETVVADAQQRLGGMLAGATLRQIVVSTTGEAPPEGRIHAAVEFPGLVGGSAGERSLLLPGGAATPAPSLLDGRSQSILLSAGTVENEWRISLPWTNCGLEPAASSFEGELGSFRQEATLTGSSLVLKRRTVLRAWQVPPERFGDLRAVALAEHRALKRRLRLACPAR